MRASSWFTPGHAYVPGRTARHPDGHFDHIRATARPGLSPIGLAESDAFRHGLFYIGAGFFWEAHEVLEPVWMVLPEGSAERRFVQALIQTANGLLKLDMDRPKAALRLCAIARDLLPEDRDAAVMGCDVGQAHAVIDSLEMRATCEI